ncbi:MAG: ABC transporter permease, partial [Clostridium sp.]
MFLSMLIKEIKQFFRGKANVFLMFAFPIMLITVLSVGLKDMMSGNGDIFGTEDEHSKVYYTIEDNSKYEEGFVAFKEGVQDTIHVKFIETPDLELVKENVDNYNGLLHIDVTADGFEIYSSEKGEKFQSKIFRSVFEDVVQQYALYDTIGEYNPEA